MIDLSLAIDVAGAALFALVGAGILVLARGGRRGLLIGAAATTFGATWVFQNIVLLPGPAPAAEVGLFISSTLATASFLALARELARGRSPAGRRWLLALAALAALQWIALIVASAPAVARASLGYAGSAYYASQFSLVLLVGAIAVAFHEERPASRALACLGLAFGPFLLFLAAAFAGSAGFSGLFGTGFDVVFLAMGVTTSAAVLPFARGARGASGLPRLVFPLLVAAGLVGLVLIVAPENDGFGAFGIVRTMGASFLALGVVRYDLLGVPLPRLVARRGTLATAALATLLIVAQVAQEFLAAEYGLLIGGVLAGALLFAANPIQRAFEARAIPVTAARGATPSDVDAREAAYRKALRIALRDRALTPEEETHLHELAEQLGIGAGRAHALFVEVRREVGP